MAVITTTIVKSGDDLVLLTVTFDDVTNDLVQYDLVCTVPTHITAYRKTGNPWRDATVDPGSYVYPAGGPVQDLNDLSRIEVGW